LGRCTLELPDNCICGDANAFETDIGEAAAEIESFKWAD
jgi:hypothetical protein